MARLTAKGGTFKKVREWLFQEWDLTTSEAALSEFFSWYSLRQRMEATESTTQDLQEMLSQAEFGLSPEQVAAMGNLMFITSATRDNDPKTFVAMAKVLLANRKLDMEGRRITLLEQKAAKADAAEQALQNPELTEEEKNAKLREVFGMPPAKK